MALALGGMATASALTGGSAVATDGSLYSFGVEALVAQAVPDGQCSVAQAGASFGVTCPPTGASFTGTKWQIDLRTPVPGSVIEALDWRAVRFHQTATSIAQQVLADGALAWQVAESDIPRSPSQPRAYQVGMRALTASLRLSQTELRQQPNRVWTFLDPTILVRDLEAPSARWTSVPDGWVTADQARVEWQASDNFGSDGIGQQRVGAAGRTLHAAAPGQGPQAASIDLSPLPDGVQTLRLEVDGDGTGAAAFQDATLRIDRTPPTAAIGLLGPPDDGVRVAVSVGDATSGVRDWTLRARSATGPTVASSSTGGDTRDIDLAALAAPGETIRFALEVRDNAGLSRQITSAPVTRPAPTAGGGPATTVIGVDGRRGALPRQNAKRLRPRAGARVPTRSPVLRWKRGARGTRLYNVQIFRVIERTESLPTTKKVLSAFPRGLQMRAPRKRLRPSTCYVWRVWPYTGRSFTPKPVGVSNFCVASAKVLKRKAAQARARKLAAKRRAALARARAARR